MLTEAKRGPLACGAKSTAITQLPLGGRPEPPAEHVVCAASWKSTGFAPVIVKPFALIMRFELPVLVNVAVCTADVVPTGTLPKVRVFVERLATAPAPVPMTGTVWGLLDALSATLMSAFAVPTAEGAKSTAMTHAPPFGPTPAPPIGQVVVESIRNSLAFAPVGAMLVMFRVPVPVFVSVRFIGKEVVLTV